MVPGPRAGRDNEMTATVDNAVAELQRANAELQRQLAESGVERDEALAERAALAEVLDTINRSPGDLAPVFDAMLERAIALCAAEFGVLTRIEGENFSVVASHGAPPEFIEAMREPQQIVPGLAHNQLMEGADVVQVEDVTAEEVYRSGNPARRALADLAGARTGLCVALRKDGVVLGTIIMYRQEVRLFTNKQIALLQNFAAQAVIAMENARLLTETREALEQQTATAEVLGVINSSPGDLAPVFDAILEKAHTLCGVEYGTLQLYDGEKFRAVAIRGLPVGFRELLARPYALEPDNPLRSLLDGGRLVQLSYVLTHHEEAPNSRSRMALDFGIRTMLFLPLRKDSRLTARCRSPALISRGRR